MMTMILVTCNNSKIQIVRCCLASWSSQYFHYFSLHTYIGITLPQKIAATNFLFHWIACNAVREGGNAKVLHCRNDHRSRYRNCPNGGGGFKQGWGHSTQSAHPYCALWNAN